MATPQNLATQKMIENILDGTTPPQEAEHASSADSATSAASAANATNVTGSIGGQELGDIFESDGTTVKEATYAESAGSAASATNATNATNDGDGNNISATYEKKRYVHRLRIERASSFQAEFYLEDEDSTPITNATLAQRVYDIYSTNDIPAVGFSVSDVKGWIYNISAVSSAGQMSISVAGFDNAFNVNASSYTFNTSSIKCLDIVR